MVREMASEMARDELWMVGGEGAGGGASMARVDLGRRVLGEETSETGVGGASIMRIRRPECSEALRRREREDSTEKVERGVGGASTVWYTVCERFVCLSFGRSEWSDLTIAKAKAAPAAAPKRVPTSAPEASADLMLSFAESEAVEVVVTTLFTNVRSGDRCDDDSSALLRGVSSAGSSWPFPPETDAAFMCGSVER